MSKHADGDPASTDRTDFTLGAPVVDGQYFHRLQQAPGLGRHVLHDERSRAFDAEVLTAGITRPVTTRHKRVCAPFDQGKLGSCTANAALGCLMTEPFAHSAWAFTEPDCVRLYEQETLLDDSQIPGHYPPEDTGSTGLWSMKALQKAGYIKGYRHAFTFDVLVKLLQLVPVSVGVAWFQSMFDPDSNGVLTVAPASGVAGGHQFSVTGVDLENQWFEFANSWGTGWGVNGYGKIRFADMRTLLGMHGDVTVPVMK